MMRTGTGAEFRGVKMIGVPYVDRLHGHILPSIGGAMFVYDCIYGALSDALRFARRIGDFVNEPMAASKICQLTGHVHQ